MPWVDDVTLIVQFGFGSGPFDTPTWTNIVDDVRSVTTMRGRGSVNAAYDAGTATIVLDNSGGEYSPHNSSATHFGDLNIGTPVRIRATHMVTTYDLFRGHVSRWPIMYDWPNDSTVQIEVTEWTALLRSYTLNAISYSEQDSDARIDDVLDDVGWPAGKRNLDSGVSLVAVQTYTGNAGALIDEAVQAEQGTFFVAGNGDATFYNRVQYSGTTGSPDFGGGSGEEIANPTASYDPDFLINSALVTGATGDPQSASDATSIATYGEYGELGRVTNASIVNEAYALNVAEWLVEKYKDVEVRFPQFMLFPGNTAGWAVALAIELAQHVNVEFIAPNAGTLSNGVRIERIQHTIAPGVWNITFGGFPVSDVEINRFWILGTGELGDTIGSTSTRLA